jgi:hypothetical protein
VTRYLIQIEAENVPEALAGAPLSVEVISTDGKAQRTVLLLGSRPVQQQVPGPDSYLVRTALPSGRRLSSTVVESDFIVLEDMAVAKAVLDLDETGAAADFWREAGSLLQIAAVIRAGKKPEEPLPGWLVEASRDFGGRLLKNIGGFITDKLNRYLEKATVTVTVDGESATREIAKPTVVRHGEDGGNGASPVATQNFEWGVFRQWEAGDRAIPQLLVQHGGNGTIGAQGEVAPFELDNHRGNYLIRVSGPSSTDAGSLVAWLPGTKRGHARIAIDPDNANGRSGSVLVAFPDLEDATATTLFSYVRQGSLEEARIGLPVLVESLQQADESISANRGVLSAYVLYKFRHPYAAELITLLRDKYPELADVHILVAAQSIANGRNEEADDPLTQALACGIPTYNEGVRLLRDSSNFLCDFYPDNARFRSNARKASIIAAAANFDSSLTCLRLGRDLTAEFVSGEAASASSGSAQLVR